MADQLLICCLPCMIGNPSQSCQVMATSQGTADFQDVDIGQNQGCLSGKGWFIMISLVTSIWLPGQNPFGVLFQDLVEKKITIISLYLLPFSVSPLFL
jgi:hypothetical protein